MTKRLKFKAFINSCHHFFAKSSIAVKFFLLLRNQCYSIIGYSLANSSNFLKNGESLLIDFFGKYCKIALDVGANKGLWSEYFLERNTTTKIFLFEPSINAFGILTNKFKGNNNIVMINKGLAEHEMRSIFFEEPESGETSSILPGVSNNSSKRTQIELTTVDLFKSKYSIKKIDYLKIDVEGYDLRVLKGAKESLKAKNIGFIQFEYNSSWAIAGNTLIDAIKFLNELGYKVFLLKSNGLYNFNYALYGEYYRYSNFFALPKETIPLIKEIIKGSI